MALGLVWEPCGGVRRKAFTYLDEHFRSSAEVLERYQVGRRAAFLSLAEWNKAKEVLSRLPQIAVESGERAEIYPEIHAHWRLYPRAAEA